MAHGTLQFESEDDLASATVTQSPLPTPKTVVSGESELIAPEIAGDAPVAAMAFGGESGGASEFDEVENAGGEFGEMMFEASPSALSAEFGAESAASDLSGIEGFEMPTSAESGALAQEGALEDAGVAIGGGESSADMEFGFLAALVPTLISTAGPAIAKAVSKKLTPKARRRLVKYVRPAAAAVSTATSGLSKGNVLSLLAKLLTSAETAPLGESSAPIDETLVNETAAVLEVIIDKDDRVRITNTSAIPWRRICALKIYFPSGKVYRGTGFFIGPRAVTTAGHCVYLHDQGGWATKVEVIPGANGTAQPFGKATATMFRSVRGWVTDKKPACDYGCIILPAGSFGGRNLGQFGFASFPASVLLAKPSVLAGYPGDKPFAELWGMCRRIKTVTPDRLIYDIDTAGGQSGAGVYINHNGQRYVIGIHNYGAGSGNSATRITQPVYQRLLAWRQL